MRIRLRPPYDEDEIAASVAPLPPALLDHDVSFDTVFRPATLVKLPRNTRPTWGSEAHVKLQKRPGLSLNQSTMPAQPNGYRHVVDACSRLKITPPSSCSPDRSVWISTVVKSVSFIIDPDADETRSGVLHDRPACTPEDEAPLSSAEHVHERTLAKGYVRIVMVDGEEYVWPIDVNDAGLPSGSPGLRDRLLDLVARLKDGWQDLVDACGREDADEAMTIVRERMADPPSKWPDEATAAAAELVRLARATVFETGWRRFVLPLLKGHLEPTYTIWAIRSALDGHRRKRHEILRDYASSAVLAFEALDPEFERWTARILGVVGFAEPVEEDASDVVEIEVDENVFVPIKRCRSPIDELLTPERPSKRVRSSSSPVPATSAGFETRASAPPPLPAAARLALKRRSQARLQHLDSLLQDLARADKRIKKLEAAYVSAHEDERELVHRLTVAPLQLAREKMEAKNAERQSRFDEAAEAYKAIEQPAALVTTRHSGRREMPVAALLQHRRGPVALPISSPPSLSPPSSTPPRFAAPPSPAPKRAPLIRRPSESEILISTSPPGPTDADDTVRKAFGSISPTRKGRPASPSPTPPSDGEDENGHERDDDPPSSSPEDQLIELTWGSRPDHVLGPFAAPDPDELVSDRDGEDDETDEDDEVTVPWEDSAIDMDVDELELFFDAPEDEGGDSIVDHAPLHRSLSAPSPSSLTYHSFAHHAGFVPITADIAVVSHERQTA